MVMARGIVSLAAYFLALLRVAHALFQLNIVVHAALCMPTVPHMIFHTRRFFGDMLDHLRGPGFFTTVAATGVLGIPFIVLMAGHGTGTVLWWGGGPALDRPDLHDI